MSRKKSMSLLLCPVLGLSLLTCSAGAETLSIVITVDKKVLYSDEPITATWTVTGGVPPYQIYGSWQTVQGIFGGDVELYDLPAQGSYTLTEDSDGEMSGHGGLWLMVKDSVGNKAEGGSGSHRFLSRNEPPYLRGDANGDGIVNVKDAAAFVDYAVSQIPIPSWHNSDVNNDFDYYGDMTDLLALIDMLVNP